MAALGPKMLEITARRMAGTMTWMTGPRTLADHVLPILERSSPRPGERAEVVAAFPICVTDQPNAARRFATQILELYGMQPSYRAMLDREGYEGPADAAIIGDDHQVTERIEAIGALGIEEFCGSVFACTAEDDERTRKLLGSMALAGVTN